MTTQGRSGWDEREAAAVAGAQLKASGARWCAAPSSGRDAQFGGATAALIMSACPAGGPTRREREPVRGCR
ncbi:hypothetical protein [Nocardia puris]|uniref:hypothetical protein n=1 Tax=Nocardia puris TaxID=208602 RepID=UPI002E1BC6A4